MAGGATGCLPPFFSPHRPAGGTLKLGAKDGGSYVNLNTFWGLPAC